MFCCLQNVLSRLIKPPASCLARLDRRRTDKKYNDDRTNSLCSGAVIYVYFFPFLQCDSHISVVAIILIKGKKAKEVEVINGLIYAILPCFHLPYMMIEYATRCFVLNRNFHILEVHHIYIWARESQCGTIC